MQKTHSILKALNELLENKENYSETNYRKKLLELKDRIDQQLLTEREEKLTYKEQKMLLQQYRVLLKRI